MEERKLLLVVGYCGNKNGVGGCCSVRAAAAERGSLSVARLVRRRRRLCSVVRPAAHSLL